MDVNTAENKTSNSSGKIVLTLTLYLISLLIIFGLAFLFGSFAGAQSVMK